MQQVVDDESEGAQLEAMDARGAGTSEWYSEWWPAGIPDAVRGFDLGVLPPQVQTPLLIVSLQLVARAADAELVQHHEARRTGGARDIVDVTWAGVVGRSGVFIVRAYSPRSRCRRRGPPLRVALCDSKRRPG